jgi:hypothetical protein
MIFVNRSSIPARTHLRGTSLTTCSPSTRARPIKNDATSAQQEFAQIYPAPGLVEHDPEAIWSTTVATVRAAMAKAGAGTKDIAALGITNQRETTIVWDRATGRPIHNAVVCGPTHGGRLRRASDRRARASMIAARTGLLLDPIFPPPRSPGSSITPRARRRRERGGSPDGGEFRCGGSPASACERRDQRGAHPAPGSAAASGTPSSANCLMSPSRCCPRCDNRAGNFGTTDLFAAADPAFSARRRPAGGNGRAGLSRPAW